MPYHLRTTSGRYDCVLISPAGMPTERRRSTPLAPGMLSR